MVKHVVSKSILTKYVISENSIKKKIVYCTLNIEDTGILHLDIFSVLRREGKNEFILFLDTQPYFSIAESEGK